MLCIYCLREICEGENRYYSRQAGMKGPYHWECFVEAVHEANRRGANYIEIALSSSSYLQAFPMLEFSEN